MNELLTVNGRYTIGEDEQGSYGTLVQPESEFAVPDPESVSTPPDTDNATN